jgi:hypothetical protein
MWPPQLTAHIRERIGTNRSQAYGADHRMNTTIPLACYTTISDRNAAAREAVQGLADWVISMMTAHAACLGALTAGRQAM